MARGDPPIGAIFGKQTEEAADALRALLAEARGMQRDLGGELRRSREAIAGLVRAEVEAQVAALADEAKLALTAEVDRIAAEVRDRLGLP